MTSNEKSYLSIKIESLWSLSLILFFAVSMNYVWRNGYITWYGSIFLAMAAYVATYGGKIQKNIPSYFVWIFSFLAFGVLSLVWSLSIGWGIDILKIFVFIILVLFLIWFALDFGYKFNNLLICYFIATLINAIYIVMTVDLTQLGETQLGTELIEGWNGNGMGFMTAQGVLIGCYIFSQIKNKLARILVVISAVLLSLLTIYTGSRTAFIVLVAGLIMYFWLSHPTKMVRNIIVTVILMCGFLYLVMNVESFYNVLGQRLEGLFALFGGEGEVDNSADLRDTFIKNGIQWFKEEPILGYGLNNYKVLNGDATGKVTYAHNNFIELAVDLGVVGLLWYYSAYAYLAINLLKRMKEHRESVFLLSSLVISVLSQYGTVSYYGFYQNFLLMICFYSISKSNMKGSIDCNERNNKNLSSEMV